MIRHVSVNVMEAGAASYAEVGINYGICTA